MPLNAYKAPKNGTEAIYGHIFVIFRCLIHLLVAQLLHILVQEVLSFDLSGVTSKSVKNWLHY